MGPYRRCWHTPLLVDHQWRAARGWLSLETKDTETEEESWEILMASIPRTWPACTTSIFKKRLLALEAVSNANRAAKHKVWCLAGETFPVVSLKNPACPQIKVYILLVLFEGLFLFMCMVLLFVSWDGVSGIPGRKTRRILNFWPPTATSPVLMPPCLV